MKRFIFFAVLISSFVATSSYADREGHMMGSSGYGEESKEYDHPENESMMGSAMRGSRSQGMMGYGMGPGMMGSGMMGGMGQGMMRSGGCDMMGGMMGSGMGPGMMGYYQMMHRPGSSGMLGKFSPEEQQKFLNDTVGLRKKLMLKRFDYHEASRNPETKPEAFRKIEKDMWELQKKITDKRYE